MKLITASDLSREFGISVFILRDRIFRNGGLEPAMYSPAGKSKHQVIALYDAEKARAWMRRNGFGVDEDASPIKLAMHQHAMLANAQAPVNRKPVSEEAAIRRRAMQAHEDRMQQRELKQLTEWM
jgi:hypothetical protein